MTNRKLKASNNSKEHKIHKYLSMKLDENIFNNIFEKSKYNLDFKLFISYFKCITLLL